MSYTQTNQSMREHKQVDTSTNAKMDNVKEPSLPVFIPMRIVRWILYSCFFTMLLIPFIAMMSDRGIRSGLACGSGGLILGHFASQLNALINKKA
jgi:hypothetical protein